MKNLFYRYLSEIKAGFRISLIYRFNTLVHLLTAPINLVIFYFLWNAIYGYTGQEIIRGFTLPALISYYAVSIIISFLVWADIDEWMEEAVRQGYLVTDLLRPINYIGSNFFFLIGLKLLNLLIQTIPFFIIAVVFFNVKIAGPAYFLLFFVALFMAFVLNFFISFLVGLTAFWLMKIGGIRRMRRIFVFFLSGALIPLSFFPEWFQRISSFLPFEYIRYHVINIYLEKYTFVEVLRVMGIQLVWIVILCLLGILVWRRAYKKFAGAGT